MRHRNYLNLLFLILSFLGSMAEIVSQETYTLSEESRIWVEGTSTLRDWQAEVTNLSGTISTNATGEITKVSLTMDVKTMEGGRGPDMNAKIYKALLAEEFPQMTFEGEKAASQGGDVGSLGVLSLAGMKKEIRVSAKGSVSSGQLTGQHSLKFSDFNIEPPSALFGQIVCHDDLTIMFDLKLSK
jgi:polyisoprenoid-binding protein YceI